MSVLKGFRPRVKQDIGVATAQQVWCYKDVAKLHRQTFGKLKGLWRVYHVMMEVLQVLNPESSTYSMEIGTELLAQVSKTLLQVMLDNGDWTSASLLLPVPKFSGRAEFGGEELEMAAAHKYPKAVRKLKLAYKIPLDEQDEEPEKPKKTPKKVG